MQTTPALRAAYKELALEGFLPSQIVALVEDIELLLADYALLVSEHERTEKELAAALVAPDNAD